MTAPELGDAGPAPATTTHPHEQAPGPHHTTSQHAQIQPARPPAQNPTPGTRKPGLAEPLAPAWGWKIPDGGRAVHVSV